MHRNYRTKIIFFLSQKFLFPIKKKNFIRHIWEIPFFYVHLRANFKSHFSSAVEQLTRNEQVEGSNPLSGSHVKFDQYLANMLLSMILFISGGEIFIILLFILIFFGADKIPEFARMMGKGAREFKKATDDIKREFHESSSGIMDDIKSIGNDVRSIGDNMTETFTKEIAEPMQETAKETEKTFDEYRDQYNTDFYYDHPDNMGYHGNEYSEDANSTTETADDQQPEHESAAEPANDTTQPVEA